MRGTRRTRRTHRRKLVVGLVMLLTALTALTASAWAEPGRRAPAPNGDAHAGVLDALDLPGLGLSDAALDEPPSALDEPVSALDQAGAPDDAKPLLSDLPSLHGLSDLPALSRTRTFQGYAFDTCTAPPLETMRRWRSSRYGAVGVYYGGRGRACPDQPSLGLPWMRGVQRLGWRVLPVYVGSQAPCVTSGAKKHFRIGGRPWTQGAREALDAVARAQEIGIRPGSPLYLDMEAYRYRQAKCAATTLAFVRAWDQQVRGQGYVPGFYSSADSGVRHMRAAAQAGVRDLPSVIWFARWHTRPRLAAEPELQRSGWSPRRRIHQYAGNVKERHGGRTLVIDRNLVHAPVARIG